MARLSDIPRVWRDVGPWGFTKRLWREVIEDNHLTQASALAYSWLFAIFPFILFLLTLVPYLPDQAKVGSERELHELVYALPRPAADTVWDSIDDNLYNVLHEKQGKVFPRLVGLLLALWVASGGMTVTISALDKCYELDRGRKYLHQRPFAIGLTLIVIVLALLVISLMPVGSLVRHWLERKFPSWQDSSILVMFDIIRYGLSLIFIITVVALLYHFGPHIKHRFHWLTPGGLFCVLVWIGLGYTFRVYVTHFADYGKTYGAVGGVVVLLLIFYLDALVLLIGAEINSEIDFEVLKVPRGSKDFRRAEDRQRHRKPQSPGVVEAAGNQLTRLEDQP